MLSVFGQQPSELAEQPSVSVWMLSVFGRRPCEGRRMLHSIRRMPCAFGAPPLSAPTAAPRARRDAVEAARGALRKPRAALRETRDALLEPRDALGIRGDAVRTRGADLRRITGSSRTPLGALLGLDHAAVEPRTCRHSVDHAAAGPRARRRIS